MLRTALHFLARVARLSSEASASPTLGWQPLVDHLAQLYPGQSDARRLVARAGLNVGTVSLHAESCNTWHSIVKRAVAEKKLATLLRNVAEEFPGDTFTATYTAAAEDGRVEPPPPEDGGRHGLAWRVAPAAAVACAIAWLLWEPAYTVARFEDHLDFSWARKGVNSGTVKRRFDLQVRANPLKWSAYADTVHTNGTSLPCRVIAPAGSTCYESTPLPTLRVTRYLSAPRAAFTWYEKRKLEYEVTYLDSFDMSRADTLWFGKRFKYPVSDYRVRTDFAPDRPWKRAVVTLRTANAARAATQTVVNPERLASFRWPADSDGRSFVTGDVVEIRFETD